MITEHPHTNSLTLHCDSDGCAHTYRPRISVIDHARLREKALKRGWVVYAVAWRKNGNAIWPIDRCPLHQAQPARPSDRYGLLIVDSSSGAHERYLIVDRERKNLTVDAYLDKDQAVKALLGYRKSLEKG